MKTLSIIHLGFLSTSLLGCAPPPLEDITHWPEYAAIVGTQFRAKQDLLAYGITIDANYKKRADYILIIPPPGVSGPEVLFKLNVKKGTDFRISGVVRYGYLFLYETNYVVEPLNMPSSTAPFHIRKRGAANNQSAGLDPTLFQVIK